MKRFHFSLEAVREVRLAEEQSAQRAVSIAIRNSEQMAQRLVRLESELKNAWRVLSDGTVQGILAEHMQHAHSWCVLLEERRRKLTIELVECRRQTALTQGKLQIAMQRRETLDRLQEKQREVHGFEEQSENQKNLDEIATRGAWCSRIQGKTI